MPLEPGLSITPTIRLNRLLKQGGMGSVWVADHLALHTQVAVKFMSPQLVESPAAVARFTREATAAAQLKSPHVVQILDHGVTPARVPFIVMELLEGEELGKRIKRLGPLGPRDAIKVVTETCRALGRAHQLGIVHRDIKPDNVFLLDIDGEPFVKVLDFGIAKHQNDDKSSFGLTTTGSMVGTPYYMSPEQLLSAKHVDLRSDLWSLGIVTYRMLTGRVPFRGETLGALCVAIEKGVFAPPSKYRPGLPPAVDAWFLRALARDAAQRFGSAKELADAFAQTLAGVTELPPMSLAPVSDGFGDATPEPGSASQPGAAAAPSFSYTPMTGGSSMAAGSPMQAPLSENTGPSVHPAFATRTSPGPLGRDRRTRPALFALGLVVAVAVGIGAAVVVARSEAQPTTATRESRTSAAATSPPSAAPAPTVAPAPPAPAPSAESSSAPEPTAEPEPVADKDAPLLPARPRRGVSPPPQRRAAPPPRPPAAAAPTAEPPARPKERDRGF